MEQFLELFGKYSFLGITVYKWFLIGGAIVFLVQSGKKAATMIGDLYERKRKNDEMLHHALEQVTQYPKWHEQSLKIQEKFTHRLKISGNARSRIQRSWKKWKKAAKREKRINCVIVCYRVTGIIPAQIRIRFRHGLRWNQTLSGKCLEIMNP